MHSKCTMFTFFVVAKNYPWFIQKLSETIHDLCRENFLSHQQETFFSKWGRNSVYSLDHKTPPYQHRNHRIWRKIKPAFITFWPRTESRLCFADCRITACVRRLSSWRWLWKLKEQLLWKNSQRLWNRVNIFLSQGLLLISIIIPFFFPIFQFSARFKFFSRVRPKWSVSISLLYISLKPLQSKYISTKLFPILSSPVYIASTWTSHAPEQDYSLLHRNQSECIFWSQLWFDIWWLDWFRLFFCVLVEIWEPTYKTNSLVFCVE